MSKIYTCFPGGKHKVVTLSYDDGKQDDRRLIAIFNQYGLKGTFHLNFGLMDQEIRINREEIKELYQGHEVAAHTMTHPTIARCPLVNVVNEVLEDRKGLESLVGYPVRGLSYPNGSFSKEIEAMLPGLGIRYSRTVGSTQSFGFPENWLEWNPTCHHNQNLLEITNRFVTTKKPQYLEMLYVWGHSYEFSRDNNWDMMEEFCKMVSHQDDTWYATNIQIYDYFEAVKRLEYTADAGMVYNPSVSSVWISIDDVPMEIKGGELTKLK